MKLGIRLAAVLVVAVTVAAACGDDDDGGSDPADDIVFGEGTIPESIPQDFPIPSNAAVGTTLVDKINNRTEFGLTMPADVISAVQFFQVGLVNQGYIVGLSEGTPAEWTIEFSDGDLEGTILFSLKGEDLTALVVGVNRS